MKALTGESEPVWKGEGDKVLSGSINGEGTILVRTESSYSDSTASKIMKLVNESEGKKARSERFITRFSRYYTPFVCLAALLVAFIPPVFGIMELSDSLYRACMLLVISCPCALVLSVPLAYFASMGSFARHGILIKGDESIQNLASIDTIAMDKTGTLTEGRFSVRKVVSYGISEKELLSMAASLERSSSHPIASAIVESADENILPASNVKEIPGIGIEGIVNGKTVKVGNSRILSSIEETDEEGTVSYVAEDGKLLGYIVVRDEIKEDAPEAIEAMRNSKPVIVSNVGALPELIENKVNGYVFDLDSDFSLKNVLHKLNKNELKIIGNNNRKILIKKFINKIFVKFIRDLYEKF